MAMLATGAFVAASASAELLPELGRCVKPAGAATHKYETGVCTTKSAGENTGKYEWEPEPGVKPGYTSTSGTSELETVEKLKIKCTADSSKGEFTGSKTDLSVVTFTSCKNVGSSVACENAGAKEGEIITKELKGEYGFISGGGTSSPSVGVALKPVSGAIVAEFECGGALLKIDGGVIAPVTPIDKMSLTSTLAFKATKGKQVPEKFETGLKNTLIAIEGKVEQQVGLTTTDSATNEEQLEIKAVV